jgi:hypothetical protein
MRYIIWTVCLAALSTVWMYGCDRAARATEVVIWELILDDTVVSESDLTYDECVALKGQFEDPALECVPSLVEREES